ncbi:MAG: hypothetical protein IPJ65_03375 [Archangiaceae bacterium]|nr:hypothetical protein [Archangiaceae bacterium]
MLAAALALTVLAAADDGADAGYVELPAPEALAPEPPVPSHYDSAPLKLDGRTIDFYPDAGTRPPDPWWLHIRGNRVLPEEMYRDALHLPADTVPDAATASYIEETLYGFLVKSGYELATVGAVVTWRGIDVQIDEGQVEKMVFTGRLTFNTLRFRLELFIDQDVFNRPALERQVAALSQKIGLNVVRWSLVPTPNPDHVGPQIESLGAIEGFQILHERKRYELWFFFQENEWDTGFGVDVRSGYIDGLEVGLNYQGNGFLRDHWRVAASGGAGLNWRISDHILYPGFSRAFAEFQWVSRPLGRVRVGTWVTGNLVQRQRKDLDVESYNEASSIASVHTTISLTNSSSISPGIGLQWRRIFNINSIANADPALTPPTSERARGFFELRAEWIFDPENQRWDRRHRFEVGGRFYFGLSLDAKVTIEQLPYRSYGWLYERYQKVFTFGWHDLWLGTRARLAFGDVQFHDEENVAELLRVFGDIFVRKGGQAGVEFRFSLTRDVLKLSFFTIAAAFGEVCRGVTSGLPPSGACAMVKVGDEAPRFGISGGPGLHALIQGMFQLDMYAAFGILSTGRTGASLVVILNKTY